MSKKGRDKGSPKAVETDPDKLAVLLFAYAFRRAAAVGWRAKDLAIARGEGVEDIVQDALASLYGADPDRSWDSQQCPDPMDYLRSFVNSRLSDLPRLYEFRRVDRSVDPEEHVEPENPESLIVIREQQHKEDAWYVRARGLVEEAILSDELLLRMHDLAEKEGVDKPAELAQRLAVSVDEVKNAKKRYLRIWIRVIGVVGVEPSFAREANNG